MAVRDQPGVEYIDIPMKDGRVVQTMNIKLYAPDGSVFVMPHGGSVLTYTAKEPPFKTKPDAVWRAAKEELDEINAAGQKLSDYQRESKNRRKALDAKVLVNNQIADMEREEAEMQAEEDALNGIAPSVDSFVEDTPTTSQDAPEAIISADTGNHPAPAVKAKPKAKAKAKK